MLLSMTGFGEAHRRAADRTVAVEVRTINSRHYKLSLRSPEGFAALEPLVDAFVREQIRRGTVQVNIRGTRAASPDDFRINSAVLTGYLRQLAAISSAELGSVASTANLPLGELLNLPGVVEDSRVGEIDPEGDWQFVQPVLQSALDALLAMRRAEGQALAEDLANNAREIGDRLTEVESRSPLVTSDYRQRLLDRVNRALSDLNVTVEPSDLVREVSLYADRSDISEEIVRLRSHLGQFLAALKLPESSGRKLEFISQEMGREINTIGSKANDTQISQHVVDMKTALERIREQVQNVE